MMLIIIKSVFLPFDHNFIQLSYIHNKKYDESIQWNEMKKNKWDNFWMLMNLRKC